jgi:hypothetical protein
MGKIEMVLDSEPVHRVSTSISIFGPESQQRQPGSGNTAPVRRSPASAWFLDPYLLRQSGRSRRSQGRRWKLIRSTERASLGRALSLTRDAYVCFIYILASRVRVINGRYGRYREELLQRTQSSLQCNLHQKIICSSYFR